MRLFLRVKETGFRSDQLGEKFCKLPQPDEARVRIIVIMSLGKGTQAHELNVVRLQKGKIANLPQKITQ